MELRRLLDTLHLRDFRQHLHQQIRLIEEFEGPPRLALGEHPGQLVAHPFAAHRVDARRHRAHGSSRLRFQLKSEAGRKAHRAQQAQLVFFKAPVGIADGAQHARIEVGQAADIVDDGITQLRAPPKRVILSEAGRALRARGISGLRLWVPHSCDVFVFVARVGRHNSRLFQQSHRIEQQSVDREIAPLHILLSSLGVSNLIRMPPVQIDAIRPERGNLGHAAFRNRTLFAAGTQTGGNQHDTKVSAHGKCVRKHLEHNVRSGRSGYVIVLGRAPQQQIAHATAREIGFETMGAQGLNDVAGPLRIEE